MFTPVSIYFRFWSWYNLVLRLGLDAQLIPNESVIRVTVCTMEAPRNTDTVKVNPSRQNEINLVSMLRPGMTPQCLALILQGKEGICYRKIIEGADAASEHYHSSYLFHFSLRLEANESAHFRHVR